MPRIVRIPRSQVVAGQKLFNSTGPFREIRTIRGFISFLFFAWLRIRAVSSFFQNSTNLTVRSTNCTSGAIRPEPSDIYAFTAGFWLAGPFQRTANRV
jgi:hypothetical protein